MKESLPVSEPEELEEVEEVSERPVETQASVVEEVPAEKPMYDAVCATCEAEIQVPFKPDGSRPTFCKDCLRDYQRATAKARNEIEQKRASEPVQAPAPKRTDPERQPVRRTPAYVPTEQPMSLAQVRHIEPKKFKALKKRQPDLGGIRALIDTAKKES